MALDMAHSEGNFSHFWKTILLPLSIILNYSTLNLTAEDFHYAEDFLQIVTLAIFKWCSKCMENIKINSPTDFLHSIRGNKPAYELTYALI